MVVVLSAAAASLLPPFSVVRGLRTRRPPEAPSILRGRSADHPAKIPDEVRLIGVAEVEGEIRPVDRGAGGDPFGRFVEAVALDDLFRADADIFGEQALERPGAETEGGREVLHPRDLTVGGGPFGDPGG